jgi:hypothetical protein
MITFNKIYFFIALLVFIIEVLIALFIHDNFVRPYIGDVLVVILIYCFLKAFIKLPVLTTAILVLIFAFTIEILQYFNFVEKLGLEGSEVARTVLGTSYAWTDLIAYSAGIIIVLVAEFIIQKQKANNF